jgi:dienelactone hydrolase
MVHHEGTFTTPDAVTIYQQSWLPDGEPKAVVLLLHGLAEHSGRYTHVAKALTDAGYAVVVRVGYHGAPPGRPEPEEWQPATERATSLGATCGSATRTRPGWPVSSIRGYRHITPAPCPP